MAHQKHRVWKSVLLFMMVFSIFSAIALADNIPANEALTAADIGDVVVDIGDDPGPILPDPEVIDVPDLPGLPDPSETADQDDIYYTTGNSVLSDNLRRIEDEAFLGSKIRKLVLPEGLREIGSRAFASSSLRSVYVPESVVNIAPDAFESVPEDFCAVVDDDSYAEEYFRSMGIEYKDYPESPHPCPANYGRIWDYSCDFEADYIRIRLDVALQPHYDRSSISIRDASGREYFFPLMTLSSSGRDVLVQGNRFTLQMLSVGGMSGSEEGFRISDIEGISFDEYVESHFEVTDGVLTKYHTTPLSELHELVVPDTVHGERITRIGENAFLGHRELTRVELPEGITDIDRRAFAGCSSLSSFTIPYGVSSIGYGAFESCSGLEQITIPDTVPGIGAHAFAHCDSLSRVIIPESVTQIGAYVFADCAGLSSVAIPGSVTGIGDYAFSNCGSLTDVTISEGLAEIGGHAFYNCDGLRVLKLPDSVKGIGEYAFAECEKLGSVTLSDGVAEIGAYAFTGCGSLSSVTLPASVIRAGDHIFDHCSGLTSVTIPGSLTVISPYMFYSCTALSNVTILNGVKGIGTDAFSSCTALRELTLPDSLTSIGFGAFRFTNLHEITIPDGVTELGEAAFEACLNLRTVLIPEGVTSIGDRTFRYCIGCSITIPESVTSIHEDAFLDCEYITVRCKPGSYAASFGNYGFQAYIQLLTDDPDSSNPVRYRALLIGLDDYSKYNSVCRQNGWPKMSAEGVARNDLTIMRAVLTGLDQDFQIETLMDCYKLEMTKKLINYQTITDDNDVTFIYIIGHGMQAEIGDQSGMIVLPTVSNYWAGDPEQHFYKMQELYDALSPIKGKKILVLGTCGSGAALGTEAFGGNPSPFKSEDFVVITAVGEHEQSQNNRGMMAFAYLYGNAVSWFAQAFGVAMDFENEMPADLAPRDQQVTLDELVTYMQRYLDDQLILLNAPHDIHYWPNYPDSGELVLFSR